MWLTVTIYSHRWFAEIREHCSIAKKKSNSARNTSSKKETLRLDKLHSLTSWFSFDLLYSLYWLWVHTVSLGSVFVPLLYYHAFAASIFRNNIWRFLETTGHLSALVRRCIEGVSRILKESTNHLNDECAIHCTIKRRYLNHFPKLQRFFFFFKFR